MVLSALLAVAVVPLSSEAGMGTIQPGDAISTSVGGCTVNFVFDGGGKVYIGTAAHCVSKLGEKVFSVVGGGCNDFGTVAYIGDADSTARDFALIEVRSDCESKVSAAVKGHPQYPTGSTTYQETTLGDAVQFSGYGLGFGFTAVTQEERVGVFQSDNAHSYQLSGPTNFGDSGGPIVHVSTGEALGIISRFCTLACTDTGPTVEGMLKHLADDGLPVTLRTV